MKTKLILAPIRGVTTAIFRNIYNKYFSGIDEAIAPFITTTHGKKISESHMKEILPKKNNTTFSLIPQLIGNNREDFIQAAKYIFNNDYKEVNWNLGCPAPTIRKKQRGAGLIIFPEKIETFLKGLDKELEGNVSVKIRLGLENPDDIFKIIPILNNSPISSLTIHPRTALQSYNGVPDIERYKKALSLCKMPVIYSGDINDSVFYEKLKKETAETTGWMLGRGLLMDPFLPALIKEEIKGKDRDLNRIINFHDELFSCYEKELFGPASLLGRMKELWSYLHRSFSEGDKLFKKIKKATTISKYMAAVKSAKF